MTRFEERGVEFQMDALTIDAAVHSFDRSCSVCCTMPGLRIDCDNCAIALAHKLKIEYFSQFHV